MERITLGRHERQDVVYDVSEQTEIPERALSAWETIYLHLVAIGHRAVAPGKIANAVDGRDVAVHRIKTLEHDQLRPFGFGLFEQLFEVAEIIMAPDVLL